MSAGAVAALIMCVALVIVAAIEIEHWAYMRRTSDWRVGLRWDFLPVRPNPEMIELYRRAGKVPPSGADYGITRGGVLWRDAPSPPLWHRCRTWSIGRADAASGPTSRPVYRCACGGLSFDAINWTGRNDRWNEGGASVAVSDHGGRVPVQQDRRATPRRTPGS